MVAFNNIPATELVPLFTAEVSNRSANMFQNAGRVLLIGISKIADGVGVPFLATDEQLVIAKTGAGSMCWDMFRMFRQGNTTTEVWILPVAESSAGVAATGTLTLSGTATADGILHPYINGVHVPVPVAESDTASSIATALAAAINANTALPVTASATAGAVALTSSFKGLVGNDIPLNFNIYGLAGGESFPAGITADITVMSGGAGNPDLALPLNALGDQEYDFITTPFIDAPNLNTLRDFMNDVTGRWSPDQQIYGHVFGMFTGSAPAAQTLGSGRNDQHTTIAALPTAFQAPYLILVAYVARASARLISDPARPCQFLPLIGIMPPEPANLWNKSTRRTLLMNGIATLTVNNGQVQIERLVSTYQKNATGVADISYRDVQTLFTLQYIIRYLRSAITSKFPDFKLADDGYAGNDTAVVTPGILKAEIVSAYHEMATVTPVVVENESAFLQYLVVERNKSDVNRVDVLLPPDLVNQLRIFAMLVEFRLNF